MTTTTHQQGESVDLDKLSADIMNLPCKPGRAIAMNGASVQAYKEGHRDARHAAAELVNERASQPSAASDAQPVGADERAQVIERHLIGLLAEFNGHMPPGSLTYIGHRNITKGLRAVMGSYSARAALATPAGQAGATVAGEPIYQLASVLFDGGWHDVDRNMYMDQQASDPSLARIVYAAPASPAALDNTAKEALRDLSHVENHLEKSGAPTTIKNRAVDVRSCVKELMAALASPATQQAATKDAKDAARYRFLAGADVPQHSTRWQRWKIEYWRGYHGGWEPLTGEELDIAIDAAMSASVSEADGSGKGGGANYE